MKNRLIKVSNEIIKDIKMYLGVDNKYFEGIVKGLLSALEIVQKELLEMEN